MGYTNSSTESASTVNIVTSPTKELAIMDDYAKVFPQSSNTGASTCSSRIGLEDLYIDLEERISPSRLHDLEVRLPFQHTSNVPSAEHLPSRRRLAWLRYVGLNIYRRLFSLVSIANLIAFVYILSQRHSRALDSVMNATAANLLALGLARQPLVINTLFYTVASIPRSAPLRLRRLAAKIYCYGGLHSGCGVAAFIWYNALTGILSYQYTLQNHNSETAIVTTPILVSAWMIEFLLLAIIVAAYPSIRFKLHDYFELTHRFCSWAVIILFWPLLGLFAHSTAAYTHQSTASVIISLPLFWMLIITTLAILHPWLLLRRVPITPETLSTHAIRLHFSHTTVFFGHGLSLARSPLRDWHSFATFVDTPATPGGPRRTTKSNESFSCLISKAGDWTSHTIATAPTQLWTRGIPTYGFGYVLKLFSRVILVTTGSGIGPCLSLIGDPNRPAMRVVWQTRAPYKTYGDEVVGLVKAMDADPVIIDTSVGGKRVDMLPLVLRLYREFGAEAVAVISNPMVTRRLVWELESRRIPAFGPIFDS